MLIIGFPPCHEKYSTLWHPWELSSLLKRTLSLVSQHKCIWGLIAFAQWIGKREGGSFGPLDPEFCAKHDPSHPHRAVLKCLFWGCAYDAQTLRRFNEGRLEIWPLAALVQMCCCRNGLSDGLIPTPKNHELFLFVNVLGRDSWTQIYWELQSSCQISHHSHDTFTLHSDQLITRMDLPREERNKEGHHRCLVVGAGTNPILLQFHFFGPPLLISLKEGRYDVALQETEMRRTRELVWLSVGLGGGMRYSKYRHFEWIPYLQSGASYRLQCSVACFW